MQLNFNKVEVGQTLNFAKDFGEAITGKVTFNLNWGKINGQSVDLDSILVMESRGGIVQPTPQAPRKLSFGEKLKRMAGLRVNETIDMSASTDTSTKTVYFGNLRERGVEHQGDDRTGAWAKGEFIEIDLDRLNPNVDTLTFSVLSFSGHNFGSLPFAEMKVSTGSATRPIKGLVHHELTQFSHGTKTVVLAQMKKVNGEWQITALQRESQSRDVRESVRLAKSI